MTPRLWLAALLAAIVMPSAYFAYPHLPYVKRQHERRLSEELKTVALTNCTLRRYGGSNDGGYLMCGNLMAGVQSAYSYGIGAYDDWGCAVSKSLNLTVHQYDCFSGERPACDGGRFVFHDECVGPRLGMFDGEAFDTIASQIGRNGDAGRRLVLKIDVEGAEWDSLQATPEEVLERVDQMAMELHGHREARFIAVLQRLKRQFHLVNVHFNNNACSEDPSPLPAWAFQVLLVNKRLGTVDPTAPSPVPPSPLNTPDNANMPDCQSIAR